MFILSFYYMLLKMVLKDEGNWAREEEAMGGERDREGGREIMLYFH